MHWEFGVVFLIWWCLTAALAKCNLEFCGSQNVSYPFWIDNQSCGYPGFQIKCMEKENEIGDSTRKFAPFLGALVNGRNTDLEILHINYTGSLIINSTSLKAMSCNETDDAFVQFELPADGPFTISSMNRFVVIGCKSIGSFTVGDGEGNCKSACPNQLDPKYCNTYGCCEAGIPGNKRAINFTCGGMSYNNFGGLCGFSTILDPLTWELPEHELGMLGRGHYGLLLDWGIGHGNCSAVEGTGNYCCATEANCIDSVAGEGHSCRCVPGYEGNGYSNGTGCSYVPSNAPTHLQPGSDSSLSERFRLYINPAIISVLFTSIGAILGAGGLFWWARIHRLKRVGDKNFIKNGGHELQERIASMGGRKSLRMFSEIELKKTSNNFSIELGRGGFSTVYKGVLSDGIPIAIKKPKAFSLDFINEIVILSHTNHRNVVKLIGCCLRTQLPLLVYEFVSNGTLFQHLHSQERNLPWERRRQIAIETAEGIAYMHREASQPIFHRDIKSSNILLDDTFTPKVADFGISRLRPFGETHLSTMFPSGTPGYVDPEFVRTNQFTDKSDVYSFGVVLLELLTGLRPVLFVKGSVCTLYDHFLSTINDNRLSEILDQNVVKEENQGQMEKMAMLAKSCLQVKASERPSMREVVEELAWIRATTNPQRIYRDVSLVEHKRPCGTSGHHTCPPITIITSGR